MTPRPLLSEKAQAQVVRVNTVALRDEALKSRLKDFELEFWEEKDGAIEKRLGPSTLRVKGDMVTITNATHAASVRIPLA